VTEFGHLSNHAVGVILREMVRLAIESIQAQRFDFDASEKSSPYRAGRDLVTSADLAAQAIYVHMIMECLPGVGIIAEEDNLRVPSTLPKPLWITVDPLDGTQAFTRRQSHGIGTMISLVNDQEVLAAYVGDAITREIYGFRPGSAKVHRISRGYDTMRLEVEEDLSLNLQHALLHNEPREFSLEAQQLFLEPPQRIFKSFEITRGSIGMEFTRLWKGEVGGIFIRPGSTTPWDFNPIFGISRHMGFKFLQIAPDGLHEVEMPVLLSLGSLEHELLVVHQSRVHELS
jgi:fructose-1,6-bisphosphatase/inositol monophosphatase family enzyme